MTNVEKLKQIGILESIRMRLGAANGDDESRDGRINGMTNHQLVKEWCGWELGDGTWWTTMKSYFDQLESK